MEDITPKYDIIPLKEKLVLPEQDGFASKVGGAGGTLGSVVSDVIKNDGSVNITSGTVSGITLEGLVAGSDIAIQGWTSTLVFSATDYRIVAWTSGAITLSDGTVFTITSGNTGNMAALTFVYFDKTVSETTLQITTTAATSVGANKILVAVANLNSDTTSKATFQAFGGMGGQMIAVDNIAANSTSTNELISNTAQIKDATITNAKITSLGVDKLTAGDITSKTFTLKFTEGEGDCGIVSTGFDATNWRGDGVVGMGIDDSDNNRAKWFVGNYSSHKYAKWDGVDMIITGAIVNLYLGDGSDGDITLNGTNEYSDPSITKSGSTYTLTCDIYASNLTIDSGVTLKPNGYAIYVLDTFTNNGTVEANGANGSDGDNGAYYAGTNHTASGGAGGAGGGSVGSTFGQAPSGGVGGYSKVIDPTASSTAGTAGTDKNPSLGSSGAAGGDGANILIGSSLGGPSYSGTHNHGGGAGTATGENLYFREPQTTYTNTANYIKLSLRIIVQGVSSGITLSHSAGSGGGGAGLSYHSDADWGSGMASQQVTGGGGGGGGGAGGVILIAARHFVNNGTISANGGDGGRGGNNGSYPGYIAGGAGGGGGAGSGGVIIIIKRVEGSYGTVRVSGGTGGVHGTSNSGDPGVDEASDGSNGVAGKIYQFIVS